MEIRKGDFVLVEYTLSVKETGELVDTTSEEEARARGIYDERERYGPRLVIVGEGRLIRGLEEALEGKREGEEFEVEIPPEKAYGKRDPNKVKAMPRSVFIKHNVIPEPGKIVEINGQYAVIRQVAGGRVIVDFNHPLAGKTLKAKIKIVKVLDRVEDKVKHLMLRRVKQLGEDDVAVEYDEKAKRVTVKLSGKALNIPELQMVKRIIVDEVRKHLGDTVAEITFIEEVKLAAEEKKEAAGQEEKMKESKQSQS